MAVTCHESRLLTTGWQFLRRLQTYQDRWTLLANNRLAIVGLAKESQAEDLRLRHCLS